MIYQIIRENKGQKDLFLEKLTLIFSVLFRNNTKLSFLMTSMVFQTTACSVPFIYSFIYQIVPTVYLL